VFKSSFITLKYFCLWCPNVTRKKVTYIVLNPLNADLTLILLTWNIGWAPNNASKWQIKFNSAFKGLNLICHLLALLGAHHIFHVNKIRVNYLRQEIFETFTQKISNYWLSKYNWQAVLNNRTVAQLVRIFIVFYEVVIRKPLFHKRPTLSYIAIQINLVYTSQYDLLNANFIFILTYTIISSNWLLPFRYSIQKYTYMNISVSFHACYESSPSTLPHIV
jgi:hypothetical protein